MTLFEHVLIEKELLEIKISALENDLANAPDGTLVYHKNGERILYYRLYPSSDHTGSHRREYIKKKNMDLVYALAKKTIDKKMLQDAKAKLHAVNKFISSLSACSEKESDGAVALSD